jgi:hypothetical protein
LGAQLTEVIPSPHTGKDFTKDNHMNETEKEQEQAYAEYLAAQEKYQAAKNNFEEVEVRILLDAKVLPLSEEGQSILDQLKSEMNIAFQNYCLAADKNEIVNPPFLK